MARKHTKESLTPIVESSTSVSQVLVKLGIKNTGGNYRLIQQRIREYEISIEHFKGIGWSKGLTVDTSDAVRITTLKRSTRDEDIFKENSGVSGTRLRKRLFKLGWKNECSICGLTQWLGKAITCHVDHINGVNGDNRLTNLRMVCPNCHQQTTTWGNKGSMAESLDATDLESVGRKDRVGWTPTRVTNNCIDCNVPIYRTAVKCKKCEGLWRELNLSKRPTKEELQMSILKFRTNVSVGKHYNVSGNTIKKWKDYYKLYV